MPSLLQLLDKQPTFCPGILQGSQSGMQYERRRYTKAVGDDDPAQILPKTKSWLQAGFGKVRCSPPLHLISPPAVSH